MVRTRPLVLNHLTGALAAGDNIIMPMTPAGIIRCVHRVCIEDSSQAGLNAQLVLWAGHYEDAVLLGTWDIARAGHATGGAAEIVTANYNSETEIWLYPGDVLCATIPAGDTGTFGYAYYDRDLETEEVLHV